MIDVLMRSVTRDESDNVTRVAVAPYLMVFGRAIQIGPERVHVLVFPSDHESDNPG